jgi:hypothetical protein
MRNPHDPAGSRAAKPDRAGTSVTSATVISPKCTVASITLRENLRDLTHLMLRKHITVRSPAATPRSGLSDIYAADANFDCG